MLSSYETTNVKPSLPLKQRRHRRVQCAGIYRKNGKDDESRTRQHQLYRTQEKNI